MDISLIKNAEIKNFEKQNKDVSESKMLSPIFGLYDYNIKSLLDFGFTYDYEGGYFVTKLEINNYSYLVWIQKLFIEQSGLRKYKLSFQQKNNITLKGAYEVYLYSDINIDCTSINIQAFFNHIYNVYKLNHILIEEKDSFKKFVENEKSL